MSASIIKKLPVNQKGKQIAPTQASYLQAQEVKHLPSFGTSTAKLLACLAHNPSSSTMFRVCGLL